MSQIEKISRILASPPKPEATQNNDDWLDVAGLYRIVRRRIWLILLIVIAITAAGLPVILSSVRSYSASTKILIHEPASAAMIGSGRSPQSELNLTTEAERLLSRDVAVKVIAELDLETRPEFNPQLGQVSTIDEIRSALRSWVSGAVPDPDDAVVDPMAYVLPQFLGRLAIFRAPGSDVINIGFTSEDPVLAAQVPNTLVRIYLDSRISQSLTRISSSETWLSARISDQQARLDEAIAAADSAKADAQLPFPDTVLAADMLTRLSEARQEIVKSRTDIEAKLAALADAQGVEERAATLSSPAIIRLQQDLDAERAGLAQVRSSGRGRQSEITFQGRIAEIESRLEAELVREERRLRVSLSELELDQTRMYASFNEAQAAFSQTRRSEAQLAQLQRDVEKERAALDALEAQRRDLVAEAQLPAAEIEILAPATVPLMADGRGRSFSLILLTLFAGVTALTLAFIIEMLDKSVRSREQLASIPHLRFTGFVPVLPRRVVNALPRLEQRRGSGLFRDVLRGMILSLDPPARQSAGSGILVTSPLPGEGKTTLALALAAELSRSGRSVLLVDADMRHGTLARRFAIKASPGLSDVLSGKIALDQAIRLDRISGVSVLPRGSIDGSPSFDANSLRSLLRTAAAAGYTVVIDGPSTLVTTDALVLAAAANRTILVARWGKTSLSSVETAADRLSLLTEHEVDAVIVRVNLRRQALYGYRDGGEFARKFRMYHARS